MVKLKDIFMTNCLYDVCLDEMETNFAAFMGGAARAVHTFGLRKLWAESGIDDSLLAVVDAVTDASKLMSDEAHKVLAKAEKTCGDAIYIQEALIAMLLASPDDDTVVTYGTFRYAGMGLEMVFSLLNDNGYSDDERDFHAMTEEVVRQISCAIRNTIFDDE